MIKFHDIRFKRGSFRMSLSFIEAHPELAMKIFGSCIIYRAEMMDYGAFIEYEAISPQFDTLELGVRPPDYDVIVEKGKFLFSKRGNIIK